MVLKGKKELKRIFIIILSLMLTLSLCSCDKQEGVPTVSSVVTSAKEPGVDGNDISKSGSKVDENVITAGPELVIGNVNKAYFYYDEWEGYSCFAYESSADCIFSVSEGFPETGKILDSLNTKCTRDLESLYEESVATIDSGEADFNSFPWSDKSSISVVRNDSKLLSLEMNYYSEKGGAHPNHYSVGYNYDQTNGTLLGLSDFVTDYDGFYAVLIEKIKNSESYDGAALTEHLFEDWEETVNVEYHENEAINFTVSDAGMIITFCAYDIAPYSEGDIILEFAYDEYYDYLNPDYFALPVDKSVPAKKYEGTTGLDTVITLSERLWDIGYDEAYASLEESFGVPVEEKKDNYGELNVIFADKYTPAGGNGSDCYVMAHFANDTLIILSYYNDNWYLNCDSITTSETRYRVFDAQNVVDYFFDNASDAVAVFLSR